MNLKQKRRVALLGYGAEHKGLAEYLFAHSSWEIDIYDEKELEEVSDSVVDTFVGLNLQKKYDIVFKTPGIPLSAVSVPKNTVLTNSTDLFLHLTSAYVIGVTGTKGKSTITSLIYHMLKETGHDVGLAGNIGVSAFSQPELLKKKYVVYEMSSYQCEQLTISPHIAVFSNLFRDHIPHHGSMQAYRKAKKNITRFQTNEDFLVTTLCGIETQAQVICVENPTSTFKTKLVGEHNQLNVELALQAALIIEPNERALVTTLSTYTVLPGRIECIAEKKQIAFYDDALATIPEATIQALKAIPETTVLIVGGEDRGADFSELRRFIQQSAIQKVIYFKDTGEKIVDGLKGIECVEAHSMKEAVEEAFKGGPGICMLSSASPSFSMFENYKDRSKQYLEEITKYQ